LAFNHYPVVVQVAIPSSSTAANSNITEDGIPELARTLGRETIDMLSKAKMR
jgi:hypothetical protein